MKPSSTYLEFQPSPRFTSTVECFWILSAAGEFRQAVLPDGCCDFIFATTHSRGPQTHVVGTMTKPRSVALSAGDWLMGARVLRFRRALAYAKTHPTVDMPQLAIDCGYFDQSHMIRDFNEFAGKSPSRLVKNVSA